MVIGDRPLDELVPLYRDPKSSFPITQYNWKLVEAAGLVKFDFLGLKTLTVLQKAVALIKRGRGIDVDLLQDPARRPQDLRAAGQGRHGRRVPAGRCRRAREPQAPQARPLRGHHGHDRALPARPHGQHPHLHQPQARGGAGRLPASHAGADPEGDPRRHHLPGAGAADRPGDGRLLAGPGRHPAQGHGQEGQVHHGQAAGRVRGRRGQEGREARRGRLHLRAGRQVRRLRLQQGAHGRLLARGLLHGLPQGQLPRGVPGGLHDAGRRQHRQARHVHVGGQEVRHRHPAALHQRLRGRFPRRREDHPLLAGGAQEHRRAGGREHRRRARRQRPVQGPVRLRRPLQHQGAQQARAGDARRRRRLRQPGAEPRPGARQRRADAGVRQPPGDERGPGHRRSVRRRSGDAAADRHAAAEGLDAHGAAAARVRRGRLLPLRPSARCLRERAGQARHRQLRGARGARRPRRHGRAARRRRRLGPRAPVAEGQQVRLRHVLGAHRPVRGGDLLRDAGRLAPSAGVGDGGAADGGRRARRRKP